ncbi:MAG: class I SAM-dependent methyltransferase [Kangiellaceae bacterium]
MITQFKLLINHSTPSIELSSGWLSAYSKKHNFEVVRSLDSISSQTGIFEFKDNKLILHLMLDGQVSNIYFDLNEGSLGYRAKNVNKTNELIARAIGCKSNFRPNVLDATAGMGRDALIMSKLGCQVVMQERCHAIFLLLENALARLNHVQPEIKKALSLENINSISSFSNLKNIDVIYLDPMFPSRKKSALVKKEMRLFKRLAGEDLDADQLLQNALDSSVNRVVVKRPKTAPQLGELSPSHEITSKNFRFDVYLK